MCAAALNGKRWRRCRGPSSGHRPSGDGETGGRMPENAFLSGEYLQKIPQWHTEDSPWKAKGVLRMLKQNGLSPRIIGEVGCGAGEVLRQLQLQMEPQCLFFGYDIGPQAIELSGSRENDRLHCR